MTATARRLLTRHMYAVLDAAYDAGVREFDAARCSVAPRSSSGDGCARADPRA
jgi:aryl-alcohol dehydrogenase-like predicted oxidoreductase